jgi:hypothetical protein
MSTDTGTPFWESKNISFVDASPECDLLHPESRAEEPGGSLTETQYLGFNVADHGIHGLCYMWHHPNLGVVTGGAWVWQGIKRHNLQSEIFDMVTFTSDACLINDLWDYRLENGYHVTTIEPLRRHRIRYADAERDNRFDIELQAVTPAVVLSTGKHLEQGMRARGELTLRGRRYDVDCFTVRDRSWGQLRPERLTAAPPMAWMTCVFDESFAFGCTAFDDLDNDPEWAGQFQIPGGDNVKGGWVWRDGELIPVVSARKRTERDPDSLFPTSVQLTITDAAGRDYELYGEVTAAANWRTWHNFESIICSTRWSHSTGSGEIVGQGDLQECQWSDYIRAFTGDPTGAIRRTPAAAFPAQP